MTISIIIPCYNEAENIVDTVDMIKNGIDNAVSDYEIILVDDGSTDNSQELICALLAKDRRIHAAFHPTNCGKGAALRTGFEQARMDWVLTIDTDLQIDIAELKFFLPYCAEYDLITGVRVERNDGFVRSVVSKIYNFVAGLVIGANMRDVGCPFKLMKTSFVKKLTVTSARFAVDAEILLFARLNNYQVKQLNVNSRKRIKGKSTVTLRNYFETLFDIISLKARRKL